MFDSIRELSLQSDYDFRETANPDDPLRDRFEEWVPYYKLKWAIARHLQPASILEVGVRFGYSAAAFLHGSPKAHYLGIDLDSDDFGGVKGAIEWARKIVAPFSADLVVADSQKMERFPGEIYDLIHVDGQQDGDGTFHDMELAIRQGRYVVADGYFWNQQNCRALTEFLYQNRDRIEFYGVIPGYAGELVINVQESNLMASRGTDSDRRDSSSLRETYAKPYYLGDCGGYVEFNKHGGKYLEDTRLRAVASIARLKRSGRMLDLGSGRGELAYYFAKQGFEVTAIDYSKDAVALAAQCFENEPELKNRVRLLCDDVCRAPIVGPYDVVIASDLIEHLAPAELEVLYKRVAKNLHSNGVFVVHTFPNAWFYRYEYPRKRRIAASVGAYLSPQPRSHYEILMHINEQSPGGMRKSLRRYFEHALLWFGDGPDPGGSLVRKFTRSELRAAPDLFAVASHNPVDSERIVALLRTPPLRFLRPAAVSIAIAKAPSEARANEKVGVEIELKNASGHILNSYSPNPIQISYHWLNSDGRSVVHDGERTPLWPILEPGDKATYSPTVVAPPKCGLYRLRMTLVQEAVRWFDDAPLGISAERDIRVS